MKLIIVGILFLILVVLIVCACRIFYKQEEEIQEMEVKHDDFFDEINKDLAEMQAILTKEFCEQCKHPAVKERIKDADQYAALADEDKLGKC